MSNDELLAKAREDTAAEKQRADAAESERDALKAKLDAIYAQPVEAWIIKYTDHYGGAQYLRYTKCNEDKLAFCGALIAAPQDHPAATPEKEQGK